MLLCLSIKGWGFLLTQKIYNIRNRKVFLDITVLNARSIRPMEFSLLTFSC